MPTQNTGRVENLNPWKPGQSGNPSGRPKGLARYARERCGNDGAKLVDFYESVLDDDSERTETRMQAAAWLADRAFGRAVDVRPQDEGDDPLGLTDARERLARKLAPVVALHASGDTEAPLGAVTKSDSGV